MIQKKKKIIETIIFDMDGVIIDSEGIWKKAEKEVFSSVGVKLSDELYEMYNALNSLSFVAYDYVDNNHKSLIDSQIIDLNSLKKVISSYSVL